MKKSERKFAIATISIVLAIIALTFFFIYSPTIFSSQQSAFTGQCSLESCPSGYTASDSCTSTKCIRTCTIPARCDSNAWTFVYGIQMKDITNPVDGQSYTLGSYTFSSSKCYKNINFGMSYSFSGWGGVYGVGGAKSYTATVSDNLGSKTSSCITSGSGTAVTHTASDMSPGTGATVTATMKYNSYGGSSCSGGQPTMGMSDRNLRGGLGLEVTPYLSADTQIYDCTFECSKASTCGTNEYTGSAYCKNNNVYQLFRTWSCNSNSCSHKDVEQLKTSCPNGCDSATSMCNGAPPEPVKTCPTVGQCVDYRMCAQSGINTILNPITKGACGVQCTQANIIADCGSDNYECNNYLCQAFRFKLGTNELVAFEGFAAGDSISKYSLRYPATNIAGVESDFIDFTDVLPAIVITAGATPDDTATVERNKTIYNMLRSGATLQVPLNQIWNIFYVIDNNYQLPVNCESVDVDTGQCKKIADGLVTVCSRGQIDVARGLCVLDVDSSFLCPTGRYDTATNTCIYNPPLQAVCPPGSVYVIDNYKCEYTPVIEAKCPDGLEYVSSSNLCIYTPELKADCPDDYMYNNATDKCEIHPNSDIICTGDFIYNSTLKKCTIYPDKTISCPGGYAYNESSDICIKYPDTRTTCPANTKYNITLNTCTYTPSSQAICQIGFIYNSTTNLCQFTPANSVVCDIAGATLENGICTYYMTSTPVCSQGALTDIGNGDKACIYTPQTVAKCPDGTIINQDSYLCEYHPATKAVCTIGEWNKDTNLCEIPVQVICPQGTFNNTMKACVLNPNLQYLCLNGKLTTDSKGVNSCTIFPKETIVCPKGSIYNSTITKCVSYPDFWQYDRPGEFTISSFTWILIIVVVVLIITLIYFIKRKRKR